MTPEQQKQIALCQGDWNDLPGRSAEFRTAALLKKYPAAAVQFVAERSEPRAAEPDPHTSEPWKFQVNTKNDHMGQFCTDAGEVICDFGHATPYEEIAGTPPSPAHARLIAAAPELLEALIEVREDCIARASPSGVVPIGGSAWCQLNEAIAKTEKNT